MTQAQQLIILLEAFGSVPTRIKSYVIEYLQEIMKMFNYQNDPKYGRATEFSSSVVSLSQVPGLPEEAIRWLLSNKVLFPARTVPSVWKKNYSGAHVFQIPVDSFAHSYAHQLAHYHVDIIRAVSYYEMFTGRNANEFLPDIDIQP